MKYYVSSGIHKDKDYDVAVLLKYVRGTESDRMVQHWCLSCNSVQSAKYFAMDILEGMTLREVLQDSKYENVVDTIAAKFNLDPDEHIPYELITKLFVFDIFKE